ncbi:MAG: shikimate kinase [Euryarchaeota archaeon]|nr:shikimate kinase [Euryarchaeota archaeon]
MTGIGKSYGAITVVNAMPTGMGATIGIDLETRAAFTPGTGAKTVTIVNDPGEDTAMARCCVGRAYEVMGKKEPEGWTLEVDSEIPVSRGLKSSSSACNAILHAVFNEYGFRIDRTELVRHGVHCARKTGVTVTGSFDDACGCEFGGLVITDNRDDSIIYRRDIEEYDVVLHIPERKIRKDTLNPEVFKKVGFETEIALSMVEFHPFNAMTMNGRLISSVSDVDNSVAEEALRQGALGAGMSGAGPAISIVFEPGRGQKFIERSGLENTMLVKTRSSG